MSSQQTLAIGLALFATTGTGPAQEGQSKPIEKRTMELGAVSGGYRYHGPPYYVTIGPDGLPVVIYPMPLWLPSPGMVPVVYVDRGPLGGPAPPAVAQPPAPAAAAAPARPVRAESARSEQLVTIGDRLFRVRNLKRAEERYEQACRADPGAAAPRVRLMQLAVVRGQYNEAADRLREAVAAEPGWLARAPDIQSIYREPREFQAEIARLESHLLLNPGDRNAWLVLGAQLYLAGQTRRASDVFLRLTDRAPDPTLTAFLAATRPAEVGR